MSRAVSVILTQAFHADNILSAQGNFPTFCTAQRDLRNRVATDVFVSIACACTVD